MQKNVCLPSVCLSISVSLIDLLTVDKQKIPLGKQLEKKDEKKNNSILWKCEFCVGYFLLFPSVFLHKWSLHCRFILNSLLQIFAAPPTKASLKWRHYKVPGPCRGLSVVVTWLLSFLSRVRVCEVGFPAERKTDSTQRRKVSTTFHGTRGYSRECHWWLRERLRSFQTWIELCRHLCVSPSTHHSWEPIKPRAVLGLLYNS